MHLLRMKIVLQHAKTALYLKGQGTWTSDVSEALDFGSSKRAIKYLRQSGLEGVQVLVAFVEPECVETVALQLPRAAVGPVALNSVP